MGQGVKGRGTLFPYAVCIMNVPNTTFLASQTATADELSALRKIQTMDASHPTIFLRTKQTKNKKYKHRRPETSKLSKREKKRGKKRTPHLQSEKQPPGLDEPSSHRHERSVLESLHHTRAQFRPVLVKELEQRLKHLAKAKQRKDIN